MQISPEIHEKDVARAMNWLSGLVGGAIKRRVQGFAQHEARNPLLATIYRQDFQFEYTFMGIKEHARNRGRLPHGPTFDLFYGFVVAAHRIHAALPDKSRIAFEGRLRDIPTSKYGARPLAFELAMAVHVMRQGWDVHFADLCEDGRYDFLATRGSVSVEIECKTTSADTGRKIHRDAQARLVDLVSPSVHPLLSATGCHLVRVTVPDRLSPDDEELNAIAVAVGSAISQGESAGNSLCRVSYYHHVDKEFPGISQSEKLRRFVEELFGVKNGNIVIHCRGDYSLVAVLVESEKPDNLISTITDQLKVGASQCTVGKPAIVALQLADRIERSELQDLLDTPNELHWAAQQVFRDDRRSHVDSLAFAVPQFTEEHPNGIFRISGDVLMLHNPNPKFPCPDARLMFSNALPPPE